MNTKTVLSYSVLAAHFAANFAVSRTVALLVWKNLPENLSPVNRAAAVVGSFLISSVVTDVVVEHVEAEIVEVYNAYKANVAHKPNQQEVV